MTLATTFGGAPIIVFWKVPPYLRKYVEEHILEMLEHETLHVILHKIGEAKKSLDSIFPDVESLTKWRRMKVLGEASSGEETKDGICPHCKGKGKIKSSDIMSEQASTWMLCQVCKGTGKVKQRGFGVEETNK